MLNCMRKMYECTKRLLIVFRKIEKTINLLHKIGTLEMCETKSHSA